jgi:CheY-like chemotaxis protein
MADKKQIVYCDDQQRFRDEFTSRHKEYYDIVTVEDTRDLLKKIDQFKKLPDLVLIDLYHPRDDDITYEQKRLLAEESLAKLDKQIDETNQFVLNAWEPGGLEVLRLIRQKYSLEKLRIAFYTQKGLVLLSDAELREAKQLGVDWLIKKKLSPRTEKVWMDQMMMTTLTPSAINSIKLYKWGLAVSWLITGLLLSRLFFSADTFADIASTVLIGILSAIASFLVAPLIEKISQ